MLPQTERIGAKTLLLTKNDNFFGETVQGNWNGDTACPAGASTVYDCFSSFFASGNAALTSPLGQMLLNIIDANPAISASQAFSIIGWQNGQPGTLDDFYGNSVSSVIDQVRTLANCLFDNGMLGSN